MDAEAAAFLRDQRHLINLQAEHLHEQRQLQLAHLQVRRWKDRMSLSLQVLAVFAGAVLVVAFAGMAWHAHEDHGLLIDAFEVPPEFAADGRSEQAVQVNSDLATSGARSERGWAYAEWSVFDLNDHANVKAARTHGDLALQYSDSDGAAVRADIALVGVEVWSGHDEQALMHARHLDPIAHRRSSETTGTYYEQNSLISSAYLASLVGDFKRSADQYLRVTMTPEYQGLTRLSYALASTMFALNHDPVSAQRALAPLDAPDDTSFLQANAISAFMGLPAYWIAAEHGDWSAALQDARAANTWLESNKAKLPVMQLMQLMQLVWIRPLQALAMAKAGDVTGADALIDTTAADCYLCLRVRGLIAAERRDWLAADRWLGEAVRQWQTPAWNMDACRFYRRIGGIDLPKARFIMPTWKIVDRCQ